MEYVMLVYVWGLFLGVLLCLVLQNLIKQVKLKLHKNMKKGEEVVANIKFTVPLEMLIKEQKRVTKKK